MSLWEEYENTRGGMGGGWGGGGGVGPGEGVGGGAKERQFRF